MMIMVISACILASVAMLYIALSMFTRSIDNMKCSYHFACFLWVRIKKGKKLPKNMQRKFLDEKDYSFFLRMKHGLEEVKYGMSRRKTKFGDCQTQLFAYENDNLYVKNKVPNEATRISDGRGIKIADNEDIIELKLHFPLVEWLALSARCGKILDNIEKRYGRLYEEED